MRNDPGDEAAIVKIPERLWEISPKRVGTIREEYQVGESTTPSAQSVTQLL
ncbi:hypothetical protein [Streptomyces sp. NPDC017964]|uniref:hypothetical protein n=1 Tax=Streptomyces sp. NPDC017964 TaxID=3365022 RepID=UPI0037A572DA